MVLHSNIFFATSSFVLQCLYSKFAKVFSKVAVDFIYIVVIYIYVNLVELVILSGVWEDLSRAWRFRGWGVEVEVKNFEKKVFRVKGVGTLMHKKSSHRNMKHIYFQNVPEIYFLKL